MSENQNIILSGDLRLRVPKCILSNRKLKKEVPGHRARLCFTCFTFFNVVQYINTLLGHKLVLHDCVSSSCPVQLFPRGTLAGNVHCRVLDEVPFPHETVQVPHVVHTDHFPSTIDNI